MTMNPLTYLTSQVFGSSSQEEDPELPTPIFPTLQTCIEAQEACMGGSTIGSEGPKEYDPPGYNTISGASDSQYSTESSTYLKFFGFEFSHITTDSVSMAASTGSIAAVVNAIKAPVIGAVATAGKYAFAIKAGIIGGAFVIPVGYATYRYMSATEAPISKQIEEKKFLGYFENKSVEDLKDLMFLAATSAVFAFFSYKLTIKVIKHIQKMQYFQSTPQIEDKETAPAKKA